MCLATDCTEAVEWRGLIAQERVAIIGLGGVGAWIADFVVKADPFEKFMVGITTALNPRTYFACPVGSIRTSGSVEQRLDWFQEDLLAHPHECTWPQCKGSSLRTCRRSSQETTFAFVAVDDADGRMMVCDALANAGIPFVVVGLSPVRKDKRVKVSMRIVTAHVGASSWRHAIPQVGQAGQDDYGSLDLPDVYAMAAGWAIQSWRKIRSQFWQREKRRMPRL